jgi:hypothetical protein
LTPLVLSIFSPVTVPAQEIAPEFRAETNLVLVPVVVRNTKGEVVSNLTKEDFRLIRSGKRAGNLELRHQGYIGPHGGRP